MDNNNQIKWLLNAAASVFSVHSDSAKLDAELLMCHVLDCDRTYLFTWSDKVLNQQQVSEYQQLCDLRAEGQPIAHLVGVRDFWTLTLKVSPKTLIPRPDTETLVEHALALVADIKSQNQNQKLKGLDLGTGTGAIALALASELPSWDWVAADFIIDAVELAKENAKINNVKNCQIIKSDWFNNIPQQKFNLIVSNPPYIDENDPHLSQGDVRFEPLTALTSEDNGLSDIKKITSEATRYLSDNGILIIEHGNTQGYDVQNIFNANGFKKVRTVKDLSSNDRITVGYFILME